ncbi:hypothetical protein GCM10027162_35320 [Streptomyces incanus]
MTEAPDGRWRLGVTRGMSDMPGPFLCGGGRRYGGTAVRRYGAWWHGGMDMVFMEALPRVRRNALAAATDG